MSYFLRLFAIPILFCRLLAADGPSPDSKTITLQFKGTHRYLNLPVRINGPSRVGSISVDGDNKRTFEIQLADGEPDWWAPEDISLWKGETVTLKLDRVPVDSRGPALIDQTDEPKLPPNFRHELFRPQFHYSAPYGFELDVEGGVFYGGYYHLFYDWCNLCTRQGSSIWGHAISRDLVHWKDVAITYPYQDMWSGTGVIDWDNTSGLGKDGHPAICFFHTRPGHPTPPVTERPGEQFLIYSTDGCKTMIPYAGNPVVPAVADSMPKSGPNRDPKVFWYAPTKQWFMIIYVAMPGPPGPDGKPDAHHNTFRFLSSPNLRDWKLTDFYVENFSECPDFYELPVDGNPANKKWVINDAGGKYLVGTFDGTKFTAETPYLNNSHGTLYAGQTFNAMPEGDNRKIKMMWMPVGSQGEPFANAVSLPVELTLHSTPEGLRLASWPAKELDALRKDELFSIDNQSLPEGADPLQNLDPQGFEMDVDLDLLQAKAVDFIVEGMTIHLDASLHDICCKAKDSPFEWHAPLKPENGHVQLRIYSDKTSVELFAQHGFTALAAPNLATPWSKPKVGLRAIGGAVKIDSLKIYSMRSIWDESSK